MALHGSDLRLFAHRVEYERVAVARGSQSGWQTLARCRCAEAPEFTSELAPHAGGLKAVRAQHHAHVVAVEGPPLPKLTRAQVELMLSWDEAARQLRPPGPPAGERWHASADSLVRLRLLRFQPGQRAYRPDGLEPTQLGMRVIRLLRLREETDPLRRRAHSGAP